MKRIKIMLVSLTLVAAVGGALAFKAAKRSPARICTTATVNGTCTVGGNTLTCANMVPTFTLTYTPSAQGTRCVTIAPADINNCNQLRCPTKALVTTEVAP